MYSVSMRNEISKGQEGELSKLGLLVFDILSWTQCVSRPGDTCCTLPRGLLFDEGRCGDFGIKDGIVMSAVDFKSVRLGMRRRSELGSLSRLYGQRQSNDAEYKE